MGCYRCSTLASYERRPGTGKTQEPDKDYSSRASSQEPGTGEGGGGLKNEPAIKPTTEKLNPTKKDPNIQWLAFLAIAKASEIFEGIATGIRKSTSVSQ
jgi:hypothetical protein